MNLLTYLDKQGILSSYAQTIDWWLAEGKFKGWDARKVSAFTGKLHKLPKINTANIHHGARKGLAFPKKASKYPQLFLAKDVSEGRDWIRHIRNAIAHGNTSARKHPDGTLLVEMKDYKSDGITQTAYILIPIDYLKAIKEHYEKVKKSR